MLKTDFELLDGFDEEFTPAYYEDTDPCFSMRYKLNKKVYYQPLSKIIHFEGISSGKIIKAGSVKEYQLINAEKFTKKWASIFRSFPAHTKLTVADKFDNRDTILFIDFLLPEHDKNSGSRRIFELIKIFRSLNFNILFLPVSGRRSEPYFSELINLGIHIIYGPCDYRKPKRELKEVLHKINIAWISRPEHNKLYAPLIKANPEITWIYDTVDLHFVREERGLKLENALTEEAIKKINRIKEKEVRLSKDADLTIAISDTESELLRLEGAKKVEVITNIHIPYLGKNKTFKEKEGICFIGGYDHQPNIDAVLWLAKEIMPLVWKTYPQITLTLLGSNPTQAILATWSHQIYRLQGI